MKDYSTLCVWHGVILKDEEGNELSVADFEKFIADNCGGARIKFADQVKTLPDMVDGEPVPETGGRNDVFFYIHDDDVLNFSTARLQFGIRWWEDVLLNGGGVLYPKEFLKKYPKP